MFVQQYIKVCEMYQNLLWLDRRMDMMTS